MSSPSPQWNGLAAALAESKRYRPLERLGKKAGRQTLLCEERATGRRVVIKLLSFGEDFAWQDLKLFEREAETLRSLDHPAIPKYLDYFDLETPATKGFALVQSYIEARSLQQQLEAGRSFSEAEIQQIGEDLLGILAYLHGRQPPVIHRDIKPSNILLGDRTAHSPGQVYLVDFGSVQTLAAREGGTITVVGTYGYMPPEQFGGRAVPASDLYSLGATLIYLASGKHPADLPQKDFRIQFEDVVNLTPSTVAWLQLLIESRLEQRISSTTEALQHYIYVEEEGISDLSSSANKSSALLESKPARSMMNANYSSRACLRLLLPNRQLIISKPTESSDRNNQKKLFHRKTEIDIILILLINSLVALLLIWVLAVELGFIRASINSILMFIFILIIVLPILVYIRGLAAFVSIRFLIEQKAIQIRYPFRKTLHFYYENIRVRRGISSLKLSWEEHQLLFTGFNEELEWLEKLLQDGLQSFEEESRS